jgi:N utilization substance protein B
LQLLYAHEFLDEPVHELARGLVLLGIPRDDVLARAVRLAGDVLEHALEMDAQVEEVVEHWRPERIGVIERNILRIALHELLMETAPPRVIIDEAVRLAQRFAGVKAPAFVNGVLDRLARRAGRL